MYDPIVYEIDDLQEQLKNTKVIAGELFSEKFLGDELTIKSLNPTISGKEIDSNYNKYQKTLIMEISYLDTLGHRYNFETTHHLLILKRNEKLQILSALQKMKQIIELSVDKSKYREVQKILKEVVNNISNAYKNKESFIAKIDSIYTYRQKLINLHLII